MRKSRCLKLGSRTRYSITETKMYGMITKTRRGGKKVEFHMIEPNCQTGFRPMTNRIWSDKWVLKLICVSGRSINHMKNITKK